MSSIRQSGPVPVRSNNSNTNANANAFAQNLSQLPSGSFNLLSIRSIPVLTVHRNFIVTIFPRRANHINSSQPRRKLELPHPQITKTPSNFRRDRFFPRRRRLQSLSIRKLYRHGSRNRRDSSFRTTSTYCEITTCRKTGDEDDLNN